MVDQWKVTGSV